MAGFLYRLGCGLKDMGERLGWSALIRAGLKIREIASNGKAQ
jgi:hypothetical protein